MASLLGVIEPTRASINAIVGSTQEVVCILLKHKCDRVCGDHVENEVRVIFERSPVKLLLVFQDFSIPDDLLGMLTIFTLWGDCKCEHVPERPQAEALLIAKDFFEAVRKRLALVIGPARSEDIKLLSVQADRGDLVAIP